MCAYFYSFSFIQLEFSNLLQGFVESLIPAYPRHLLLQIHPIRGTSKQYAIHHLLASQLSL